MKIEIREAPLPSSLPAEGVATQGASSSVIGRVSHWMKGILGRGVKEKPQLLAPPQQAPEPPPPLRQATPEPAYNIQDILPIRVILLVIAERAIPLDSGVVSEFKQKILSDFNDEQFFTGLYSDFVRFYDSLRLKPSSGPHLSQGPGTPAGGQQLGREGEVEARLMGVLMAEGEAEIKKAISILLAAYEGRTDELIKELNRIKVEPQKILKLLSEVSSKGKALVETEAHVRIEQAIAAVQKAIGQGAEIGARLPQASEGREPSPTPISNIEEARIALDKKGSLIPSV